MNVQAHADSQLLTRAITRDPQAVQELVETYGDRICSFLARMVRDGGQADDLTQEVFITVLRKGESYDPRWPPSVWLFRIARNLALDLMRREKRYQRNTEAALVPAPAPSTIESVEAREFQGVLDNAIGTLADEYREVFLLRETEGMSYETIASTLEISPKTVSSRLHRARQALREQLEGYLKP